ncbi:MAG: energy-coupling factor transport system substrate-specific component [Thermomicrobiales bacterium]|nr:energy-coupling factor transport system substrate-specific component [Thermomicrobiales bacterium]
MVEQLRRPHPHLGAGWVTAAASLVGLAGFLYPFLLPALAPAQDRSAHAGDAPYLFALVTVLCVLAIAVELDGTGAGGVRRSASKSVALLGVLVATDATLRLVPSFLGGSPIFLLVILVGAVFGPAFGFQMGALTILVSAFITGGVGPWLPYQMLGVGWVGLTAGWLPRPASFRRWLLVLAVFGALWGFLFGAILNLWSWPFAAPGLEGDVGLYWSPHLSFAETLAHYARFYLVTSLWYDLFRAVGNAALVLTLGGPTLRVLERFRSRFTWEPWTEEPAQLPSA